jgi:hypothetical protein
MINFSVLKTQPSVRLLALFAASNLAVGCQSLERGIPGFSGYLQFAFDNEVVFEYAVPAGATSCEKNAALNNKTLEANTTGRYRCVSQPAPESQLPYNYVAISTLGPLQGFYQSSATTTRYANSEACQAAVAALAKDDQKLLRNNCGPKEGPIRVRPGEKLASG